LEYCTVYIYKLYFISSVEWPKSTSSGASINLRRVVYHYRGIYILNEDFNTAFGTLFIPTFKFVFCLCFIACFVAAVRFWSDVDALSCMMVIVLLIAAALMLIPISSMMSSLFGTSTQFQHNLMKTVNTISDSKARKYWKLELESCPVVRCKVGNMYYMEAKAKLTMLQQIVTGVITLLVNV